MSEDDDAVLTIHYYMRTAILKLHGDSYFWQIVDQSTPIEPRFTKDTYYRAVNIPAFRWVLTDYRRSLHAATSEGKLGQIVFSLIERYKQSLFMKNCFDEFVQRVQGNVGKKYTFSLLTDSEKFTSERNEAYWWLISISAKIARGLIPDGADWENAGSNAFKGWWEKDLPKLRKKPLHIQMRELGITQTAINRNVIDEHRRVVRQPKSVSLDSEVEQRDGGKIPLIEILNPDEGTNRQKLLQQFNGNRAEIEEILSQHSNPEVREKVAKRRFTVLCLRVWGLKITEIAKELREGKKRGSGRDAAMRKTINRDLKAIRKAANRIKKILESG